MLAQHITVAKSLLRTYFTLVLLNQLMYKKKIRHY